MHMDGVQPKALGRPLGPATSDVELADNTSTHEKTTLCLRVTRIRRPDAVRRVVLASFRVSFY